MRKGPWRGGALVGGEGGWSCLRGRWGLAWATIPGSSPLHTIVKQFSFDLYFMYIREISV